DPTRQRGPVATNRPSHADRLAEYLDDEDSAEEPEAESQVGVHRKAHAVVDQSDDPLPVQPSHQVSQVETVELEPEPGEAVFGDDEDVVLVDGVTRNLDRARVALFHVERPVAEPLVPHDAAIQDGDRTLVVGLEPVQERQPLVLTLRERVQVLERSPPDFRPPPKGAGMLRRNADVL